MQHKLWALIICAVGLVLESSNLYGVTRTIKGKNISFVQIEGPLETLTTTLQQTAPTELIASQTMTITERLLRTGLWGFFSGALDRFQKMKAKDFVPMPYPVESVAYEWPTNPKINFRTIWTSTPDAKHTLSTKVLLHKYKDRATGPSIVHYIPNEGLAFLTIHGSTFCTTGFNEKGLTIATRLYLKKDILNFNNTKIGVPLGPILCEVLRQARTINDAYQIISGYPHLQRFRIYLTSGSKEAIITNVRTNDDEDLITDTPVKMERLEEGLKQNTRPLGADKPASGFYTVQFWPHKRVLSVQIDNAGTREILKLKDMRGSTHSLKSVHSLH